MVMTDAQRKVLGEYRKKAKAEKGKKEAELYYKKQSHDWHSEMVTTGNRGRREISHCKKCGLLYLEFKFKPISCDEALVKDVLE